MMKKFIYLIVLVVLFSCKKEKTSWDTNMRVPILSDTLSLKNLVTDSILAVNADGSYQLVINRDLLDLKIDSLIKLPDTTIAQKVAVSVPSLNLPPGTSFINQIEEHNFNLNDIQLKHVILETGQAHITVSSPIQGATILTISLPAVTKNGVVFSKVVNTSPGTTSNPSVATQDLDLSGYSIDLRGVNGELYNTLQTQLLVQTDPQGPTVTITNSDSIVFLIDFKNLTPSYAQGYFGQTTFSDTTLVNLDVLSKITNGSIDIQNSNFKLEISNGLKVTARAKFSVVEGISTQNNIVNLTHPQIGIWTVLNQASGDWDNFQPSILDWIFDDGNSNITAFLENLPHKIKLGYEIELNPLGNDSGGWNEFFPNSRVKLKLTANMPLAIGLNQLTYTDTLNLQFKQNVDKTHLKSGSFTINASNAYPFDAQIMLTALDENNQVIFSKLSNNNIKGSGNLNNTNPTEVVKSSVEIDLTEEETSSLVNMKNIAFKVVFNTPSNGQIATLYDSQFIFLQLLSNLDLTYEY